MPELPENGAGSAGDASAGLAELTLSPLGAGIVVLVVDPTSSTAARVSEALSGYDVTVIAARDRDEALNAAAGVDLGLMLCAASLPKGSGYELARTVRERWPAAAVLLLTSGFEVFHKARAAEAGVSGHLSKPLGAAAVRAAVEEAVGPLPLSLPAPPAPSAAAPASPPLAAPSAAAVSVAAAPSPAATPAGAATPGGGAPPPPTLPSAPLVSSAAPRVELLDPVPPAPPVSAERVATFLPRDHARLPRVAVDPDVVSPAMERAILEVLPEVVEAVLRNAVGSSVAFRDLVTAAVSEAVRAQLPEIAASIVRERLAAFEAEAAHKG
ncbi:MAG: response regulator [Deltaproteobacteria bacterium]|jgi:CheY-like chemotaxis protein|nr:response regulator [Deltaproteobacteria bacterium]